MTADRQLTIDNRQSTLRYIVGVDVGTGSARAGLFTLDGTLLTASVEPIQTWKPRPDFVEQSSADIWRAVCKTVRACVQEADVSAQDVVGISFDATCSLVVLDKHDQPLSIDITGDSQRNVIVWMDHRALHEAEEINRGDYDVLKYVGGMLSPEMETPKLKWLKTHLPQTWEAAGKFLDLADFLTYRATDIDVRSLCTVTCKWTYLGHEGASGRWDHGFFAAIGLGDLFDGDKVVDDVRPMGSLQGRLTPHSADEMGLTTNCAVGVGIIDAHAGGLGLLGAVFNLQARPTQKDETQASDSITSKLETALALIGGTSNCHMAVSREPKFIDGIWGPYYGAMIPGLWLTEGGQSSAGSAIDHIIVDHANAAALEMQAAEQNVSIYYLLNAEVQRLQQTQGLAYSALLTRDLHVLPYFLGNRSPHADPYARAVIDGLTLDESLTSQALRYYATIQAVAYGTRDIVRVLNEAGYNIDTLFVTGGGTKNPLWLQEHADATGMTLVLPSEPEAVLLGSAILAATAAGVYPTVLAAMQGMSRAGQTIHPNPRTANYHASKYMIFRQMYKEHTLRRDYMLQVKEED